MKTKLFYSTKSSECVHVCVCVCIHGQEKKGQSNIQHHSCVDGYCFSFTECNEKLGESLWFVIINLVSRKHETR